MKNLLYHINITPFAVAIITINLLQVLNYQNLTAKLRNSITINNKLYR
jgi:hypothetical protein